MAESLNVWLVDDDASIRWVLERALKASGMTARAFGDAQTALAALEEQEPDVLITDIRMPGKTGLKLLEEVQASHPRLPVIVMTAHTDLDAAVAAYQGGAFEYLPKPFDIDEAVALVRRAAHPSPPPGEVRAEAEIPELIGHAPAMQEVFRSIGRLSRSSMTVLINGESGTGKELVARALHRHSPRSAKPFIALNTSAFTPDLLESELFGHEKGSFTGADSQRRGRFEQADGGTLFLDEIGELPLAIQPKLLRLLQEREYERVGEARPRRANVRVIAATNRPLADEVRAGRFREDLYYRLNVIAVALPGLHERPGDLARLAESYRRFFAVRLGKKLGAFSPAVAAAFAGYRWPGNLRELRNVIERAAILATGETIELHDLPEEFGLKPDPAVAVGARVTLDQLEAEHIRRVLAMCRSLDEAARVLGIDPATLYRKRQKLGLL